MNTQKPFYTVFLALVTVCLLPVGANVQAGETMQKADSAAQGLAGKRGPNQFVITVSEKTSAHPTYGTGHSMGFYVDGTAGTPIVMKRGETYEFDVNTDPMHDVYFSANATGWGGSPIVNGVKGQFTHKGTITFTPDEATPDLVYYACRNHKDMGWKVHVVDKGTSAQEIEKILADSRAELKKMAASSEKATVQKKGSKISQKFTLAEMMMAGSGVKRVLASDNDDAKSMILEAKTKMEAGKKALDAGENQSAEMHADSILKLVSTAQRMVPTAEELQAQETAYQEKLVAVQKYQDSYVEQYEDTVKNRGKEAAVKYDEAKVKKLIETAKNQAASKQYFKANENLQQAEHLVTSSIQEMMDKQKVVYALNLDTPEAEYKYELGRYKSYHELVPVAMEERQPSEGIKKLMDMYVKKGEEQKAAAIAKAETGDYAVAISMILSATKNVRLALKSAGVQQ